MKNKGTALLVITMVIVVLAILITVFFLATISEKHFSDVEKFALQALSLAEAGANHGVSELRKQIRTDLKTNIQAETSGTLFQQYVTNNDPLALLRDYAGFTVQGTPGSSGYKATLEVSALNLFSQIQGNYSAVITILPNGNPTSPSANNFVFPYKYSIQGTGSVTATAPQIQRKVNLLNGSFSVTVLQDNFARFALFTINNLSPGGGIVWFTNLTNFSGPVHTNSRFSFAGNPSGTFTDIVTQHLQTARYYNNNPTRHLLLDADSNPPYDVPIFQNDFIRGVDEINLPSAITPQDLKNQALGGMSAPNNNGVYLPLDQFNNVSGGIYVRGDASINLDKDAGDEENKAVFKITQGSDVTTLTLEYAHESIAANTSIQLNNGPINTYPGIPDGQDDEGPLIFVDFGSATINDPSDTEVIVQKRTNMTISCTKDIIIQDHIHYHQYNPTPLNATGYDNMLGLVVWGGGSDVRIGTSAPNNIELHAIIFSEEGVFDVINYNQGTPRGIATLLGGSITEFYGPFGTFSGATQLTGYGRNFIFDSRTTQEGMHPPYFPAMSNFTSYDDGGLDDRLTWQEE